MSIEKIEQTILDSARAEAGQLIAAARAEAERRLDAARAEHQSRADSALAETRAALEQERHQRETAARAANKLRLLTRKTELLDEVFDAAVQRFIGDRTGDYRSWLAAQLDSVAGQSGDLVAAEPDRDTLADLLANANASDGLTLSEETLPLLGGFVLRGERIDLDLSLDTQLAEMKGTLLPNLAERAFAEGASGERRG